MATKTGTVSNVSTDPRSASVGGMPFSPFTDDQWDLIVAAWGATPKREVTVTYDEGPPALVTKVSGA